MIPIAKYVLLARMVQVKEKFTIKVDQDYLAIARTESNIGIGYDKDQAVISIVPKEKNSQPIKLDIKELLLVQRIISEIVDNY